MAKDNEPLKPEQTFENAMERLEQLVEAMEGENLPLDQLLVSYEEGVRLAKFCSGKIATAEKRIEIISRGSEGEPEIQPFEPDSSASPPAAGKARPRKKESTAAEDVSLF